ncbi:MAG: hypothetical protein IPI51_13655 [Betaproteobacteria bacterium]|nr:hypothetical protein [Betaproteobacteria bacterium]
MGDDDQSIYGRRGATIENLKRLPQDYPRLMLIALEQNYAAPANSARCRMRGDLEQPEAVREDVVE